MTTRVLDLLLEISVKGTPEAQRLKEAVEKLKTSFTSLQGADIDSIFKSSGTAEKILTGLEAQINRMKNAVDKGWKLKVDLDPTALSDVDKILFKIEEIEKVILDIGKLPKPKFDLDVSKARGELEAIKMTAKQFDLDVSKPNKQLQLLAAEAQKARFTLADLYKQFNAGTINTEQFKRLETILRNLTPAAKSAGQAMRQVGVEAEQAQRRHQGLGSSVNYAAREFLLLRRAAYGLGLVTLVQNILNVTKAFDQARQAMSAVFGEAEGASQLAFINTEAERLGLNITELAKSYAKFSAAGRALGLDQQLVKDNFLAVAEAGSILALSSQEVEGALIAIQQIASKGKLSLEELRQQLGDRIPGAISIAAKGLGITEAKLFSLVEQGKITSKQFLETFPAALRASFGTDQSTRIETTTAAIQRFQNQLRIVTDQVVRAGALEAFTTTLKGLGDALSSPAVVNGLKQASAAILSFTKFVAENIDTITTAIKLYAGLKIADAIVGPITNLTVAFTALNKVVPATGGALASIGTAFSTIATSTAAVATSIPVISSLVGWVGKLAAALANPFMLVLTVEAIGVNELLKVFYDRSIKAKEAAIELAQAQRDADSQWKVSEGFAQQVENLKDFSDTVALTRTEIDSLSKEGLDYYAAGARAASEYYTNIKKGSEAALNAVNAEIKQLELSGDRSNEAAMRLFELNQEKKEYAELTKYATEQEKKFVAAQEDVIASYAKRDVAETEQVQRLRDLTKGFGSLNDSMNVIPKVSFEGLTREAKGLVEQFDRLGQIGEKTLDKIFDEVIPKTFKDGAVDAISQVGDAFAVLEAQGKATASVLSDQVARSLDKLSGTDLQKFGIQAQQAFEMGKLSAQGLAIIIDGQLKAALKNMGVDADVATNKISKAFNGLLDNFSVIAQNAKVTGQQLKAALDVAINAAKTKEEIKALQDQVKSLGIAGGKMGKDVADSLTRLDDKARIAAQTMDSALGDSFNRLGIKSREQLDLIAKQAEIDFKRIQDSGTATAVELAKAFEKTQLGESFTRLGIKAKSSLKAMADQAVQDFNRIKASGEATAQDIEVAFRKMAEEVTKANGGIPPISITMQAVDFNAFDLIVKAAETAADRTRAAIEGAIPLAKTKAQLVALSDAIKVAFDKGKISAAEFGEMVTKVGYQIREMAAKPVGELAAAADLLGLKTKDQLQATADNAREAFNAVVSSGQFTSAELAKAAQQYLDAYKAANNGVIDSFDPVVAKALELVKATGEVTEAANTLIATGSRMGSGGFTKDVGGYDLRDASLQELQQQLQDTLKAYKAIGITNVEDLQIVQAIQKEINRKGEENSKVMAENAKKLQDAAAEALKTREEQLSATREKNGGGGGVVAAPGGVAGLQTFNFNFNGTGVLTPDAVKRSVAPVLATTAKRRQ